MGLDGMTPLLPAIAMLTIASLLKNREHRKMKLTKAFRRAIIDAVDEKEE